MNTEEILARVELLTEDDRTSLLQMLSADAARVLQAEITCKEAEQAPYAAALCAAAAAYAAYQLALIDEATSPADITAGNVRASFSKGSERAFAYYQACRRAAAPVLKDETFYFGGVRPCEN